MHLSHHGADCTGCWRPKRTDGALFWRCDKCLVIAYHDDATARAAIRENQLGTVLQQLANAGERLRSEE